MEGVEHDVWKVENKVHLLIIWVVVLEWIFQKEGDGLA